MRALVTKSVAGSIGPAGPPGLGGIGVYDEIPSGPINGSNREFFSDFNYQAGTLRVYLNGLKQVNDDYTETGPNSFEFIPGEAPLSGDIILIDYVKL